MKAAIAILTIGVATQALAEDLTYSNYVVYSRNSAVVCQFASDIQTGYGLWAAGEKEMLTQQLCLVVPKGLKFKVIEEAGNQYIKLLVQAGDTKMMLWGRADQFHNKMYQAVEAKCGGYSFNPAYDACRKEIVDAYKLVPGGDQ
ncbi:hypothetical protein [Hyphomicrobium sp. ghe19]|uniref:hypothetical protein n=1 Tax=Hyphomicrobium sp. ghe19 TaxID=2682968 RepID=UPI001366852D|nr:hypothetical protein HYPP_02499 [Hyphomicrobium sp. ghe19]